METKVCARCKVEKELNLFNKNKRTKDGFHFYCKQCRSEIRSEEHNKEYVREYRKINKERIKEITKIYRTNNKEELKEYGLIYEANRKKSDPIFKLRKDLGRTIRHALLYNKSYSFKEKSKIRLILGCTLEEFKAHLESLFEPWMNWSNRGLYNGGFNYGWDIDHIIPCATAKTEEEMIKLYHYTNLRPRCSYTNRVIDRIKNK